MAGVNNETFLKIFVPLLTDIELKEYELKYRPYKDELSLLRRKINQLKKGEIKFDYPLLILSVCDFKIEDEIKKYVIQVKTDLSDFEKLKYQFIR